MQRGADLERPWRSRTPHPHAPLIFPLFELPKNMEVGIDSYCSHRHFGEVYPGQVAVEAP
jgi:hypothetical protein